MPLSGLVISLSPDEDANTRALTALAQESRLDLGARAGRKLPAVASTASSDEDRGLWDWINDLDGVTFVDVVFIQFDDESALQETAP